MARKHSFTVRCDNPGCRTFEDVEEGKTPEGWYNVRQANAAQWLSNGLTGTFDLCSLACVSAWADQRETALAFHRVPTAEEVERPEPTPEPTPEPKVGNTGRQHAKLPCPFCDKLCAPQGMPRHLLFAHGEVALELYRSEHQGTAQPEAVS
jgi:hypothetical protein